MDRKLGRIFIAFVAVFTLVAFGWMLYPGPAPAPVKPLPDPNGYTNLLEASRMIAAGKFDFTSMNREELQSLMESCSNALQVARAGLEQECQVPLEPSQAYLRAHMAELAGFRRLAQVLAAEGRLAEIEERLADAANSYLTIVRLGMETGRGGIMIDCLIGQAVQAIGVKSLQGLVSRLDAKACRQATATLERLDARRETWDEVMQRERDWSRRAAPGLTHRLAGLINRRALSRAMEKSGKRFQEQVLEQRRLMLKLAARAWELEKGQPPKTASELVPEYLNAVPANPTDGARPPLQL